MQDQRREVERRYALTKIAPGDYLLPSNDGGTLWRIRRYDRGRWSLWQWLGLIAPGERPDPDNESEWELSAGGLPTREAAIREALDL